MDRTAAFKLGHADTHTKTPLERANPNYSVWTNYQSYTKVSQSTINLKIVVFIRFCVAS